MAGVKGRSGGARKGAGRTAFQPTEQHRLTVEELAACGTTQEQIARCMGITVPTLTKNFTDELTSGLERATSRVALGVLQRAIKGDNACSFFFLKCRGGWSERQRVEITGKDGGPVEQKATVINEAQIKAAVNKLEEEY